MRTGSQGYSQPVRLIEWLSDVAQRFDAALEWQEADDLLLDGPSDAAPVAGPWRPDPATYRVQ
jgi:hypothetical protein